MIRTVSVITTVGALRRIFSQIGDRDISRMNIRGTIQTHVVPVNILVLTMVKF